ncbi:hypothetical protein DFH27DRAFT_524233 [Peziza echinospora]|nr:hypothetical protein DFH27DRAFT_524233 [Peziza echinospora]
MFIKQHIEQLEESIDVLRRIYDYGIQTMAMREAIRALKRAERCLARSKFFHWKMQEALALLNSDPDGENKGRHSVVHGYALLKAREWIHSGGVAVEDCTRLCEGALEELVKRDQDGQQTIQDDEDCF